MQQGDPSRGGESTGVYPTTVRVQQDGAFDHEQGGVGYFEQLALDNFEFGLERIFDGIEVLINQRAAQTGLPASGLL